MRKSRLPNSRGFTLVELLTVIGVLSVIGTIAVSVITVTLRTTKKTDLIETARQNSDTALTQMVKNIRYAGDLIYPLSCIPRTTTSYITISAVDTNVQTTYKCINNTIEANGTTLFDTNTLKVSAATCSFVCEQPTVYDHPTITIQYTLSPSGAGGVAETSFNLPFQSSVTMRNVKQ